VDLTEVSLHVGLKVGDFIVTIRKHSFIGGQKPPISGKNRQYIHIFWWPKNANKKLVGNIYW
jgi:hypothetical protein